MAGQDPYAEFQDLTPGAAPPQQAQPAAGAQGAAGNDPYAGFEPVSGGGQEGLVQYPGQGLRGGVGPRFRNGMLITDAKTGAGIDMAKPPEEIRTAIDALPEETRYAAYDQWAKQRMVDPQGADAWNEAPSSPARTLLFGLDDEILSAVDAGLGNVSGNAVGQPSYDEALALRRAAKEKYDEEHPIVSTTGQVVGGFAAPGIAAQKMAQYAPRVMEHVAGRIGTFGAAGGGASLATHWGNQEGGSGGVEQQAANRFEGGLFPTVLGTILGGALPGAFEAKRALGKFWAARGTPERSGQTAIIDKLARPDDATVAAQTKATNNQNAMAAAISGTPQPAVPLKPGDVGNRMAIDRLADDVSVGHYNSSKPQNMRRAFDILGEEMSRAGGDKAVAYKRAVARLMTDIGVGEAQAKQIYTNIYKAHAGGDLMLGEYQSVAAGDKLTRKQQADTVDLDEARAQQETPMGDLYEYLGTSPGTRGVNMRNELNARGGEAKDTFRGWAQKKAPGGKDLETAVTDLDALDGVMAKEYDFVHNSPGGYDTRKLMEGLPKIIDKHQNEWAGSLGENADAIKRALDQLYIQSPTKDRIPMATLKQLQQARTTIRGQRKQYAAQGRDDLAKQLTPLYQDITNLMADASPRWKAVNDKWFGGELTREALKSGELMPLKAGPKQREIFARFDGFAPEIQDAVRIGWLQQLNDRLKNLGDSHDVAKLFKNEVSREIVEKLLGKENAIEFTRLVRDLDVANKTSGRAQANSRTHIRGEIRDDQNADVEAIKSLYSGNVSDIKSRFLTFFENKFKEARGKGMQPFLTTRVKDTPGSAYQIQKLRERQAAIEKANKPRTGISQRLGQGVARTQASGPDEDEGYASGGRVQRLADTKPPKSLFEQE